MVERLKEARWRRIAKGGLALKGLVRKLGNGREISFWNDIWEGEGSLRSMFTRLYNVASSKDAMVCDIGSSRDGSWSWKLLWSKRLFSWKEELEEILMQLLLSGSVHQTRPDYWIWLGDPSCMYTVNFAYRLISENSLSVDAKFYRSLWDKNAPLRVTAFCWKANLDRTRLLETYTEEVYLQVIYNNLACLFHKTGVEESTHLLLSCPFSYNM